MNLKLAAAAAATLLVAGGAAAVWRDVESRRPRGTDDQQIRMMLFEGEKAAERLDAPALARFISDGYRDGMGFSDTSVKYQIRRYLARQQALDLNIPQESLRIQIDPGGRAATAEFTAAITVRNPEGSSNATLPMRLRLAREPVYYHFLFPGEEWKVTAADGYAGVPGE